MGSPIPFFLFMFLPPFMIALIAQALVDRRKRGRVIAWAACGWTAFVLLAVLTAGPSLVELVVVLGIFTVLGLVLSFAGAIIGSELSTLLKRILGRSHL